MNGFRAYRIFDLSILAVIAIFAEFISIFIGQMLPAAGFYLSFSSMIVIIALIRWKQWGFFVSALSTLPVLYFSESVSGHLILYYLISNSMVALLPIIFKRFKTSQIVGNGHFFQLYIFCYFGILFVSRGLMGPLVGLPFAQSLMQAVLQLTFSMVMSSLFLAVFRKREGLLIDMTTYIYKEVTQE